MDKNVAVSFADSTEESKIPLGIIEMINEFFSLKIDEASYELLDHCGRWAPFIRAFEFYKARDRVKKEEREYLFDESGWYILKKKNYSFAVKAGDNGESHNHNDIGNFILSSENRQVLCDLGAGKYTRQYFSPERYKILCTSSRGHSVPIINNCFQEEGEQHFGKLNYYEGGISVEFENAYPEKCVKKLRREFEFCQNKIRLTDVFEFYKDENHVCERFISRRKPEVNGNEVIIDNVRLIPKADNVTVKIECEIHYEHGNDNVQSMIYMTDFVFDTKGDTVFELDIDIL